MSDSTGMLVWVSCVVVWFAVCVVLYKKKGAK